MIKYKDPVSGRWVNLPYIPGNSGIPGVTPEMFGAKGDGKTDDTDAIQKAVDNCPAFGTLYFSAKAYKITKTITIPKKINIEGRGCSINVEREGEDAISAALHFTNQSDMTRTVIRDVFVRCKKKAKNGFLIGDGDVEATQITIDNCKATQATEDGFKVVPMAYCIRFQDCYAESNGYSGISVVSTDYSHQMNAVSIAGCTLIYNGRHGAHVNGINIVVENCIIEVNGIQSGTNECVDANNPGSGIFIGCPENPECSSVNIVVQNNYFEPSYEAQVTTCVDSVSLRVLNNYFLIGSSRRPEGHHVTNVKCIQPVDKEGKVVDSWVSLIYKNNAPASAATGQIFTDVDGGDLLTAHSDIYAQYVKNTELAKVRYEYSTGNKQYYPVPLAGESPYRSENLVPLWKENPQTASFTMHLPPLSPGSVLYSLGFSMETEGYDETIATKPVIRVAVKVEYDKTVLEKTFDHGIDPGTSEKDILMRNRFGDDFGYLSIPRNARISLTFTLVNPREATKIVIFDPYISLYHS